VRIGRLVVEGQAMTADEAGRLADRIGIELGRALPNGLPDTERALLAERIAAEIRRALR